MADQSIPRKNQAYVLRTTLVSQADVNVMQDPPTVAAGDVQVSTDGGALANTTNAPVLNPAGDKIAEVELTAGEMNGDVVVVTWADVVGSEWQDQTWVLFPTDSTLAVIYAYLVTIYTYMTTSLVPAIVSAIISIPGVRRAVQTVDLSLYRGDTWTQEIDGMGTPTLADEILFAIKDDPSDTDDEALVLISETIGLERINGAAAAVPGNGSIVAVGSSITVTLEAAETAKLVPQKRFWDAQTITGIVVITPKGGRVTVEADVARATS